MYSFLRQKFPVLLGRSFRLWVIAVYFLQMTIYRSKTIAATCLKYRNDIFLDILLMGHCIELFHRSKTIDTIC